MTNQPAAGGGHSTQGEAAPLAASRSAQELAPVRRGAHRGRLFRKYLLLILTLVTGSLLVSGAIGVYFSYQ